MLSVLSFGGGQDSTALLYLYFRDDQFRKRFAPGKFMVIMADTGDEHPHTYEHVADCRQMAAELHVPFYFLQPQHGFHSKNWPDLITFYRENQAIGSKAYPKSCTDQLKLRPIYRFLEDWCARDIRMNPGKKKAIWTYAQVHGKIRMLIGIAADETSRISDGRDDPKWMRESIEKVYPLVEMGMDRSDCQREITELGYEVPYPSNCMRCPYMSERELLWLHRFHPEKYFEWVQLEQAKIEAHSGHPKNYGVWGRDLLPVVLARAQSRFGDMSDAELKEWKMSHGHCVKSRY